MLLSKRYILVLLFASYTAVSAEDCLVSTDFKELYAGVTTAKQEYSDKETGRRAVTFNTGDSLLAHFSPCGLGASASYFSINALEGEMLKARISELLMQLKFTQQVSNKLLSQLDTLDLSQTDPTFTLEGIGDSHSITIETPDPAFVFATAIHYRWIAPER